MSELRNKFTAARRAGKEASVLDGLVRPSCLIIDEVGHCEFDKENARLFFDLIDRRYNKEGKQEGDLYCKSHRLFLTPADYIMSQNIPNGIEKEYAFI